MGFSRLLLRQARHHHRQAILLAINVGLAIITLVALAGFAGSVRTALWADARKLHAADVIVQSNFPHSASMSAVLGQLKQQGRITAARVLEFYSMVRPVARDNSLLANLKVVAPGYPFYGRIQLQSGRAFDRVLVPGHTVIDQNLFDRLDLSMGSQLQVGKARLTVADVVVHEPDRPMSVFSFGPRIFISSDDLDALDLMHPGSRVRYRELVKVFDPATVDAVAATLRRAAPDGQESVETFQTSGSRVQRFFENFVFFLGLVGTLTLLLAGVGIQGTLGALVRGQRKTIAIMKTLGATGPWISGHYLALFTILGAVGTLGGLLAGVALQYVLPLFLGTLLPPGSATGLSLETLILGLVLGLGLGLLFALEPLGRINRIPPAAIFRMEIPVRRFVPWRYLPHGIILLVLAALATHKMESLTRGVSVAVAVAVFWLLAAALAWLALWGVRRITPAQLALKQALRGLFRPGNATLAVIVTLTLAMAVICAIILIEKNLEATFVKAYPADAPNLYLIGIQPEQQAGIAAVLGPEARFYPVIRAKIVSINQRPIDPQTERRRRGDNLARAFNLTHREGLLTDETLVQGNELFEPDQAAAQVSVLDTVAAMGNIHLGDRMTFRIQGVPLTARVSSIRSRTRETMGPYFYFVFQPRILAGAPQSLFTAARIAPQAVAAFQNTIAADFPNVSVIDTADTIDRIAATLKRLSGVIRFLALFSVAAGLLIIVNAVMATRLARIREAVYFKILGARTAFIVHVFALENLLIGLISGLLAVGFAQAAVWFMCRHWLIIPYHLFGGVSLGVVGVTTLLVMVVGLGTSWPLLFKKPAVFLREQG